MMKLAIYKGLAAVIRYMVFVSATGSIFKPEND
jgi:hypothetical protein